MEEGPLKNSTKYSVLPNGSLVFSKVRAFDEGLYKCVGLSNRRGPTQTYTAKMTVAKLEEMSVKNFEPNFGSNPLIWRKGADFELRCRRPFGFPPPVVRWQLVRLEVGLIGRLLILALGAGLRASECKWFLNLSDEN